MHLGADKRAVANIYIAPPPKTLGYIPPPDPWLPLSGNFTHDFPKRNVGFIPSKLSHPEGDVGVR